MRKLTFLLTFLLLLPSIASAQASGRPDFAGVWGIWGAEGLNTEGRPWLKGTMISVPWERIEPSNNNFDFGDLDYRLQLAIENGYEYLMFKIYVGPSSPAWIYNPVSSGGGGVPVVHFTQECWYGDDYPYYRHDNYKTLFKRMIDSVRDHITSYPPDMRNRIIGIQAPVGRSGDSGGYCGEPTDPQYAITESEWDEYAIEMYGYYYQAYEGTDPAIPVMFNPSSGATYSWLKDNAPHFWLKNAGGAHWYQHNVISGALPLREDTIRYQDDGWALLMRDEMDAVPYEDGIWLEAPGWSMYWTGLHALYFGLDIWNIEGIWEVPIPDGDPSEFVPAYEFFTKHAGYHDPAESPGAWIALRDGLDANDEVRFPAETYGPNYVWWGQTHENSAQRYINIANDFSAYGAWQDPDYVPVFYDCMTGPHMNDVGWDIIKGNYQMYIDQIDPMGTSQGYWRVGPKNQPYGRFARGFNHAQGKDAIYLDISDRFFSDQPLGAQYPITVRVVYFDSGTGSWSLKYDAAGDSQKTAYILTKTNSGQWVEKTVTLSDAYLGNLGPMGSDLYLSNTDSEDDIFHMIEIERSSGTTTCQDRGFHCCNSCVPGTEQPDYDTDCPVVCCDECVTEPLDCTGLVLLMHTDNDPVYGETATHVYDFSGNGNNGTVYGATHTSGIFDGAFQFDGDGDYLDCGSDPSLDIFSDITVSVWIHGRDFSNEPDIITNGDFSESYSLWILSTGEPVFALNNTRLYGGANIGANEWSHIVATRSGSTGRIYIDGAETNSTTFGDAIDAAGPLTISSSGYALDGLIDEVAIWNRTLSEQEIQDMFSSDLPLSCQRQSIHSCDTNPQDGCVQQREMMWFINQWKYDSTTYPMSEMMEAVVLYYEPVNAC